MLPYHTVGPGPFDKFLVETDVAASVDFTTTRPFDRNVDVSPFLRQPGILPYTDLLSKDKWLDKELGPILRTLREGQRRCVYCTAVYMNIENIGRWLCNWHPQQVDGEGYYKCCQRESPSLGCQRCDHSPSYESMNARWHTTNTLIDIPQSVVNILLPLDEAYIAESINTANPARSAFRLKRAQV